MFGPAGEMQLDLATQQHISNREGDGQQPKPPDPLSLVVASPPYGTGLESEMIAHRLSQLVCQILKIGLAVDAVHPAMATIPFALVLSNWQKGSFFIIHSLVRYC